MANRRIDPTIVGEAVRLSARGIEVARLLRRLKVGYDDLFRIQAVANRENPHALVVRNGNAFSGEAATNVLVRGDLNEAVRKILWLKDNAAHSLWRLGQEIGSLHQSKLWQLRAETWEHFCRDELKMSSVHANRLADVASNYTEKQVAAHGASKLGLILTAPPDARPKLKALVAAGASAREVATAVRAEKERTGYTRPARDGSQRHAPKQKAPSKKIECPYCGMSWLPKRTST